ncbi:hypothetical protein I7X12_19845 [Halosimplex litoreum]|uniref:Uncharacterized protein n=1 Tax=Halosimplex litoreum TaxID=1198301 RepID=A0A7T3FYB8_9EURY|nr:DUF6498-containing protein [Halosimplex litoreum]QPV62936.1 hypothetical protein I7X12_19845 [Halosimplex litoreum]
MPSPLDPKRSPTLVGFAPILLGNLVPLVGVLRFGWDPATLVVIYALEAVLSFPIAAAKALFAQRPPETDRDDGGTISVSNANLTGKRGSVTVAGWLPPLHLRTVPFAVTVLGVSMSFTGILGLVLYETVDVLGVLGEPMVLTGVASLVVGQAVDTWRDYLRGGRYETVSPYTVVETPARQTFFLIAVLIAVPRPEDGGAPVAPVLAAFVLAKLLVEWSAFRATHGSDGRIAGWLSGPDASADEPEPPRVPAGEPDDRVSVDRRSAGYAAVGHAVLESGPLYARVFSILWFFALVFLSGDTASTATIVAATVVGAGLLLVALAVKATSHYLRYGPLEYRRYGDRVVAHDRWLGEPQWAASVDAFRDVAVVGDRVSDRLLGTRTVAATTGWDEEDRRLLGPFTDPSGAAERLGLSIGTTELSSVDRRVAGAAVGSLVALVAVAVALVAGPWESSTSLLYAVFFLPVGLAVPRALWRRAYPERSEPSSSRGQRR